MLKHAFQSPIDSYGNSPLKKAHVLFIEPVLFDIKSGYWVNCITLIIEQIISVVGHNTTWAKLVRIIISV